ncbi:hypothetical protein SM438_21190 [Salmonella enterica]|nr:hypothetical protein [Salmonella enterica]MEA1704909.1 hypothetical protein [Salmonella enterica subsp. enterica serovar Minnesota]MDX9555317.1 hypothetical protein [Salmonella enterica]MDX9564541.1 hypothetical protein [Salmonella enterica]MDX9569130.1 hypothetical protein [Salmonella enterica]
MRYWILAVLLNGLFALVMCFAAPEMFGSTAYYAGAGICALIAIVITWRDPPGLLDKAFIFLVKWGAFCAGAAFAVWGAGYKLHLWGEYNSNGDFISIFDLVLPNLAVLTGLMMLGVVCFRYLRR